jgi:hypothetical protein
MLGIFGPGGTQETVLRRRGRGQSADHVPILSDGTLGANWRGMNRKRAGFKPSKDSLLLFLIPISHLVPLLEFNQCGVDIVVITVWLGHESIEISAQSTLI